MKKTVIALAISIIAAHSFAAEKQKVCIKDEKTGKETCKMMVVHKKLEGTPVPTKK